MEYGFLLTFSVNWPASSYPTYPGGDPISLDTECFSINSDISSLIRVSGLSKSSFESSFTSSVFPTPVGPTKINEAGLLWTDNCTLLRLIAATTRSTASSWPMRCALSLSSSPARRFMSPSITLVTGIPVQRFITFAKSSSFTSLWEAFSFNSSSFPSYDSNSVLTVAKSLYTLSRSASSVVVSALDVSSSSSLFNSSRFLRNNS